MPEFVACRLCLILLIMSSAIHGAHVDRYVVTITVPTCSAIIGTGCGAGWPIQIPLQPADIVFRSA